MSIFLLVDLLGFRHGGPQEKVAWSIPIEIDGSVAMIEHRKLGPGVFVPHEAGQSHSLGPALPKNEAIATQIAQLIEKGVKAATPFFNHLASVAVSGSHLNVVNNSGWLYERYEYLRNEFRKKLQEASNRKDEEHTVEHKNPDGTTRYTETTYPVFQIR